MASIADVARVAGVAASTVSYVLSGRRPISERTREKVLRAVEELGYRPDAGASALASRRTRTIGLIAPDAPDLTGAIIHRFATTIQGVARDRGHDVLLLDPREGADGIRRVVESHLVDGVILMDTDTVDERARLLRALGVPAVTLGTPAGADLLFVDLDFAEAARLAVRHLVAGGRTRLALMSPPELVGPPAKGYATRTRAGFIEAAAGRPHTVRACEPTYDDVTAWVDAVWRDLGRADGIVVQHEAALSLLTAALRRAGHDDVTVVPICPSVFSRQLDRPVDHVNIPVDAMARTAAEALLDLIDGVPATSQMFEPQLRTAVS